MKIYVIKSMCENIKAEISHKQEELYKAFLLRKDTTIVH